MDLWFHLGLIVLVISIYENKCDPPALIVSPKDTTLFYYQNATLDCIYNSNVNCVWKKDGVIVTMDYYTSYIGYLYGKNTTLCSINLYTVNNDQAGQWTCENDISEYSGVSAMVTVQECGKHMEQNLAQEKIAGGESTDISKYPWIITLHNKSTNWNYPLYSTLKCHGSLISKKWIITAGHCAYKGEKIQTLIPLRELSVVFKRFELLSSYNDLSNTWWSDVCDVVVHPKYFIEYPGDNDIALMKLKTAVEFSEFIYPVCLPPVGINYDSPLLEATIAGFGQTEGLIVSPSLLEITIPVFPYIDCWRLWNERNLWLSSRTICAGQLSGEKLPCRGDSGSGLLYKYGNNGVNINQRFVIIGLDSLGYKHCPTSTKHVSNKPNIFTKVDEFLPFINSYIRDETCPAFDY